MTGTNGPTDARLNALRYRIDRMTRDGSGGSGAGSGGSGVQPGGSGGSGGSGAEPAAHRGAESAAGAGTPAAKEPTLEQRAQYVEVTIQQAMRRGDFDNLPGAGKPLANLREAYDPDWWIRRKIEREKISGLGPPALTLRTENAALDGRLDGVQSEAEVREILEDFNRRVVEARRQLLGGPPVVTATRDVDAELRRWRERRDARHRKREEDLKRQRAAQAAMTWRERRRAKRGR